MSKTPQLSSNKSVSSSKSSMACSLMLANLLLISIFGPTVVVNCTIYILPSYAEEEQMLDRFVMPPKELISILVFMLCDIFLALALLAIRDFTSIYYGCSKKVSYLYM
uniref:Uncharacterized protein n=1 Tax=Ditylenchus dipsaci TaxID=166011 RepID=A0A915CNQ7_9BILA